MKNLPTGKGALSVAHAGHELRLHGFLEQAKPYMFILTDGSSNVAPPRMGYSQLYISNLFPEQKDSFMTFSLNNRNKEEKYITESQLIQEVLAGRTEFCEMYAGEMAHVMIEKKVDYVVCDASEDADVIHEVGAILTELAIRVVEKMSRKKIMRYEYAVTKPYNHDLNEDCIHIVLDEPMAQRKIEELSKYHISVLPEIKQDISVDEAVIYQLKQIPTGGLKEVQNILGSLNPDYFRNEYIRPYIYKDMAEDNPLLPFRTKLFSLLK